MGNSKKPSRTRSLYQIYLTNLYKHVLRSITKSEPTRKLVTQSQGRKVDSLLPHQLLAPGPVPIPALWISPGLDTAPRSEALSPIKKKSVVGTTICACTVAPPVMRLPNAPTKDQGESPLLLPPPPLKEVCLFPLLCLFCPPLLSPLPKSSMRQKTKFRCS